MQFGRVLTVASTMRTLDGTWPTMVGTYPDGATVSVLRVYGGGFLNIGFEVVIRTPARTIAPIACDGIHHVRTLLERQGLAVHHADWSVVQRGATPQT